MPRKTKLSTAVQERIVEALGVGATHEHACQYAGINPDTFYTWLKKGEDGRAPYAEFAEGVKKAEAKAVVGWLALIESAARAGNWQAAAWKLERKFPKIWGRQAVDQAAPVEFVLTVHYEHARERLTTHLERLHQRHEEDMAEA